MIECPLCDAALDVEEDELDEGDNLACDECGASLRVASLNPLEIEEIEEDFEDEDEEDEDEDEEDFEEEEEDDERWGSSRF
jgi:lysine biosynthesis protein LysW